MSSGFHWVRLVDVAEVAMGQSPDSQYVEEGLDNGVPFLQGNAEFGELYPEPAYSCAQPARCAQLGDVLVSVRAPVGEINIADQAYCIGRGLSAVRFRSVPVSLGARLIAHHGNELKRVAQGTTFEAIGKTELTSLGLLLPPREEQPVIAHILDTLDTQIRRTEELIAKLEQIKQGLRTDLLTRGIDENDQLRPPPDQAPHLYKDSPLGWIPREWEAKKLAQALTLQRGFDITVAEQIPGPYPVVSSSGISSYHSRFMVKGPGVVTGRKGKLGVAYYIDSDFWPHDTALWVKAFHGNDPRFAALLLNSLNLDRFDAATSVPTLNRNFIAHLPVAVPPRNEQGRIVHRLGTFDDRLHKEASCLTAYTALKAGLMDELLTGRVRVTPLLDKAERAAS